MNLQKSFTKKISLLLIISILSLNMSFLAAPQKARAVWGVGDITFDPANFGQMIWEFGVKVVETTIKAMIKALARRLVSTITEATVAWINSGFDGNPAYVSDFNKFLTGPGGVGDQVIGDFFKDSSLGFLCDPFRLQVSLALQFGYGPGGFERMGCTLTRISRNVSNAIDNASLVVDVNGQVINRKLNENSFFTDEGGWDAWLRATLQPQNNPVGAYLMAKAEVDAKIAAQKNIKTIDLLNGQGALSFRKCVDTYKDQNGGVIWTSPKYTDGTKNPPQLPKSFYTQTGLIIKPKEQKCETKTPGSAITAMLGFKATSDQRMNELVASLNDGIDAIFNALINALLNMALKQLSNGVLDENKSAFNDYNTSISLGLQNTMDNANTDLTNLNGMWTSGVNNPDPFNFATSVVPTLPSPLNLSTTTWYYATSAPPTITTPGTGSNVTIGFSALDQAKNNSNILINSLLNSESAYQNAYLVTQNVLTQARAVFATSSACNINYNRNDYVLRSLLIRANVITNIDGTSNSDRTIANIPWNFQIIKAAVENSNGHIAILNKAKTDVNRAGSITAVTDAMIQVNSTDFNTDPQAMMLENAKTWLRGVGSIYNSILCPINLTEVLKITTVASSTFPTF